MTDKEKATKVLNYLEGLDSECVIRVLNPLLKDEQLAALHDQLEADGIFGADEPEVGSIEAAVKYIRENMDEDDLAIVRANVNLCYKDHLVPNENVMDCGQVIELLKEYGEEHDLGDEWYLSELEIDDILCRL